MKVREVIRLVERDGWYHVRTVGSHRQYHHPTKPGTVTIAGKHVDRSAAQDARQHPEASWLERCTMKYIAIIEKGPRSYGAYVPDLPGCVAAARTVREVRKLIREAIHLHVQDMKSRGLRVPKPTSITEVVDLKAA
jgi:predicted RNase H-like HicB family nuclease/predicted RNA binding protein YcfA (HicA-like mRNA interferase family)